MVSRERWRKRDSCTYVGEDLAVIGFLALVLLPHEGALPVQGAVAIDGEVLDVLDLDPVLLVRAEVAGAEQVAVEADDDGGLAGALELHGAGQVVARRDHDLLRPRRVARVLPRLEDRLRAVRLAVALGAQLHDVQRARGHRRRPSSRQCVRRLGRLRRARRRQQQQRHRRGHHRHRDIAGGHFVVEVRCVVDGRHWWAASSGIYTRKWRRGGVLCSAMRACRGRRAVASSAFFFGGGGGVEANETPGRSEISSPPNFEHAKFESRACPPFEFRFGMFGLQPRLATVCNG
jgi:hypothetical protein